MSFVDHIDVLAYTYLYHIEDVYMVDDVKKLRIDAIKAHIKEVSSTIKRYRLQAKEINAAASKLATSNAKLKRELMRAVNEDIN